jgi:hypothetical protein
MKTFFVVILMTGSGLGMYSNCLVILGEEPSHANGSFSLGALSENLVVVFLDGIVPATEAEFQILWKIQINTYKL